ncbi:hypothetical protein FS842_000677 [Serendipita sp. 407]|nr:hypothetical protein FS842_000677 [Serendipita sp. 407]
MAHAQPSERQPLLNKTSKRSGHEPHSDNENIRGNVGNVSTVDVRGHTPSLDELDTTRLHRALSVRQISMIALGGTIGTGLFLGTGRTLAAAGPGTMLICFTLNGFIVYVTLLLLGEMATQYPVAGSFTSYATRFIDDGYGFALTWNYWFNDAVSVASDLTAAQLLVAFWDSKVPGWSISLLILLFLLSANAIHVKVYGELEYWLSSIKIVTVLVFLITGAIVNTGINSEHTYIGFANWSIGDAPFVGGVAGWATAFVTSAMSYGGTESLAITAGETKDPTRSIPRVVRLVFWREKGVPWLALIATCSGSALCFASSYVGSGQLWYWLQNLVGVSNQLAWLSIGLASLRFRRAWQLQGNSLDDLLYHSKWTTVWGPYFVISAVLVIWGVQTYSVVTPHFAFVDFLSLYLQLPMFIVLYTIWKIWHGSKVVDLQTVNLMVDQYVVNEETQALLDAEEERRQERQQGWAGIGWRLYYWIA